MNRENNCFIAIGRAVKTYGIKGELKVLLYNENSTILVDNLDVWFNINDEFVKYEIESIKSSQKYKLVKLKKYDNREILHSLIKSKTIFILRDKFPKLKTEIQDIKHIIPEGSKKDWVRGGLPTRQMIRNEDYLRRCQEKTLE